MAPTQAQAQAQNGEEEFVLKFLDDWKHSDAALLTSNFTADASYNNIPAPCATGQENIQKMIEGFFQLADFKIETTLIFSKGNRVFTERIDYLKFKDTTRGTLALPVAGIFELENGKIKEWREYLDLGTVEEASGNKMR